MKTNLTNTGSKQSTRASSIAFHPGTSLQKIINQQINNSQAAVCQNGSSVVNEINPEVYIDGNNAQVLSVINELLGTVISNSRKGQIYITADKYNDVVILNIQERNNYNGYALAYSINSMEPEALMIGGHISIKGPKQKVATVSFSFPNQQAAA